VLVRSLWLVATLRIAPAIDRDVSGEGEVNVIDGVAEPGHRSRDVQRVPGYGRRRRTDEVGTPSQRGRSREGEDRARNNERLEDPHALSSPGALTRQRLRAEPRSVRPADGAASLPELPTPYVLSTRAGTQALNRSDLDGARESVNIIGIERVAEMPLAQFLPPSQPGFRRTDEPYQLDKRT